MASYTVKTLKSIRWNTIGTFGVIFLQFIFGIFLARLIDPKEFGQLAMISVFLVFARIILINGLSNALIQKKEIEQQHIDAAFWFNFIFSLLIFILFYFYISNFIAYFYNFETLKIYTKTLSINFIFIGLNIVPFSLLQRDLEFKLLSALQILSICISSIIAIVLAIYDWSIWALISQSIIQTIINTITIWFFIKWRPSFKFCFSKFKELQSFALSDIFLKILHFFTKNVDTLLIGKYLGSNELGIYNKGFMITRLFLNISTNQLLKVLFPSFSKKQKNLKKIQKSALSLSKNLSTTVPPLYILLILIIDKLVPLIYGDKWLDMIEIIQILSLGCIFEGIVFTGTILKAIDKIRILLFYVILIRFIQISIIIMSVFYGLDILLWGIVMGMFINFLIMTKLMCTVINLSFFKILNIVAIRLFVFSGIGIFVYILPIEVILSYPILIIIVEVLVYILLYFISMNLFFQSTLIDLKKIIPKIKK